MKQRKKKINSTRSERTKDRHKKYLEPDKEVEKMGKEDKKDTVENLAVEAEEAVSTTLRGGYSIENRPVKVRMAGFYLAYKAT